METESQVLDKGPLLNIHSDGLKTTLKKIANWKTPVLDGINGFWFLKKSPSYRTDLILK